MKTKDWENFRRKAIQAYKEIPESGFSSLEEFEQAYSEVPKIDGMVGYRLRDQNLDIDNPKEHSKQFKLKLVNGFRERFGAPPRAQQYFLGQFENGEIAILMDESFKVVRSNILLRALHALLYRSAPRDARVRLQFFFDLNARNKSLTLFHKGALVYENHHFWRLRILCYIIFILILVGVCLLIDDWWYPAIMGGGAGLMKMLDDLKQLPDSGQKLTPSDFILHEPGVALSEEDLPITPGGVNDWITENMRDLDVVVNKALRDTGGLDDSIDVREAPVL